MATKKMNRDYPLADSPDPGNRKPYLTARALRAENLREEESKGEARSKRAENLREEEAKDESRSKRAENLRTKASK
jgi:hypothetical protein